MSKLDKNLVKITVILGITRPRSKLGIAQSAGALDHVLQQFTKNAGGGGAL